MKYNFCIIGVAGYVAPRHLHAIKNLKHNINSRSLDLKLLKELKDIDTPEDLLFI